MKLWLERQLMAKHTDTEKTDLSQGDDAYTNPAMRRGRTVWKTPK